MAARLIARLLKELGFVHGDIVEVQRADLVAGYVGQTALKTRAVINMAKGGVLFVDEAYALAPRGAGVGRDFGAEAVQELMRDLTTGDPVVILAGYPDEMERFLRVNPGRSHRTCTPPPPPLRIFQVSHDASKCASAFPTTRFANLPRSS